MKNYKITLLGPIDWDNWSLFPSENINFNQ